ncbi:MAG: hypothetical protein E7112_01585 [Bacteroidales bacterium]|nr:hypothetical protein [Bacteroidales bacterium]
MKEVENKETEAAGTKERRPLKKLLKVLLWLVGIWLAVLLVIQVAVSPKVLSGIVDRYASEYIDGDLSFSKVRLRMFRHFPNVGVSVEDCSLTYPAERFDSLEAAGPQGRLLYQGTGETADTLLSVKRFSAGINVAALLFGKINIPHVIITQPRIFAHSYDSLHANWNIFKVTSEADTTEAVLPDIAIGRVRLLRRPHIVYTDSQDTVFAMADIRRMSFDGKYKVNDMENNRISMSVDSMLVAGRIGSDTLSMRLDRLHMHEHEDHMDIEAGARARLATRSLGRMSVPIGISGTIGMPQDGDKTFRLHRFNADIASIPVRFDADLTLADTTSIRCDFSIDDCGISDILDGFVKDMFPAARDLRTDARISLEGSVAGAIGGERLPDIRMHLSIPQSSSSHKALEHRINLAFDASAATDTDGKLRFDLSKAEVSTYGLQLSATASVEDALGEDPVIGINGHLDAAVDSLATFLPDSDGITAEGSLSADIRGKMKLSQASIYNFAQADLEGKVTSDKIHFKSQADSIDITLDALDVRIAPETIVSRRDPGRSFTLMGITGALEKAVIELQDAMSFSGSSLSLSARNSFDMIFEQDTTRIHPLSGTFEAASLSLKDTEGINIVLKSTSNTFRMMPKRGQPEIPVISVSSDNKNILYRDSHNRVILTDASLSGKAAMNTADRRARRKNMLDSLARVYPDVPYDSLFSHWRRTRQAAAVPEWMQEEDFRAKDIKVSLDQTAAKYFREWDVDGTLGVRTGILITPYFPARNILRGAQLKITNNEIALDSLKIMSGNSSIMAKGSLSGLRRALLGRGSYRLDLDLSTDKMEADALLAAFDAGSRFNPESITEDMSEASDAEFLKMVVADTLDTTESEALIIVPANLEAEIRIDGRNISYSDLTIDRLTSKLTMKERCVQILDTRASTNIGKAELDAFYSTRTKKDISTGFNFNLLDVTTEKVIDMLPAIDTIMPLLKSFKGLINCELAATANLDTCMNILTPTLNGVARIAGSNLTIQENKMFSDLARKLKFKNSKVAKIDKMTVEGVIRDSRIEVFPFIVDVDRYTLALSGLHNFDMSYKYHVSIIRSPMVFKVGVDLYGPDFDSMKFKIGKAKYKNKKLPVFTAVIDETKINLARSIRNIYERGVDIALKENEEQAAIENLKKEIGYVNAAEQNMEELSAEEQKQLEEGGGSGAGPDMENEDKVEPTDTLKNE